MTMGILRKISSFAATALVAAAPLCIGFCAAPFAVAAPSDTPTTSTSTTNPAGQSQNLNDWSKANCPGGAEFVNDANQNTPIYLGYANGNTYLGYTDAKMNSNAGTGKNFIDPRSDAKYQEKFGTCVRVAADHSGQAIAHVFYGTLFKADESALAASGFSKETETVFQVTKVKSWEPGTTVESRATESSDNYQEMPYSVSNGQSDSGFNNLLTADETSIDLRFSQSGFYTIYLKAITTDPNNPDKSYQAEMAYTLIVGKEASVPKDLQDVVDGKDPGGSDNPPTPNPGETTPGTPTPGPGDEGGGTQPGTDPTPNPGDITPDTPTPGHSDNGGNTQPGTIPTPKPEVSPDPRTPNHGTANGNTQPGTNPDRKPAVGSTTSGHNPGQASSSRLQANSRLVGTNSARLGGSLTRTQLPRPLAGAFPTLPDSASSADAGNSAGNNAHSATPNPDSATANGSDSGSQADNENSLKFQAANTSTKQAAQQWIRSSSLAVFSVGLAVAGLTGIGLLAYSRLHP
ncbi:hypothetical protein [Varibaculum prostatecancerukia]|uniref:hypothetical protein n=1 Tax=Varibaculum prostatecancerukia TaxID=2811781 RepID=UPI001C003B0A|nr:hypothetical protein [Varibaculum prostatecancerukia]